MSANNAEPTGEVKDNPDEPILGDNGVNYDSYATEGNTTTQNSAGLNFDSSEYKRRQKTEYFVNVEGAEKRKRAEERLERRAAKRRAKMANSISSTEKINKNSADDRNIRAIIKKQKNKEKINKIREILSRRGFRKTCLILLIGSLTILCLILAISAFTKEEYKKDEAKNFNNNVAEMYGISDGDSAESSEDALEYINKKISEASSCDVKAEYLLAKAKYLDEKTENTKGAIDALNEIECSISSKRTQSSVYSAYMAFYAKIGDSAKREEYKQLYIKTLDGMKIGD